jgi:hypothetical protein
LKKILASIVPGLFLAAGLHADESQPPLTIEMSEPKVRIVIPGMHGIDMDVHPMNEHKPVFRLRGSSDTTVVSVITPKISTEVSPMSCATAIANGVLAQRNITRDQIFLGRTNERTFLIIYGLPLEESVLLNTHIVSSDESTQCIEAQVSKISTSESDIEPWFNGFAESSIENL